VTFSVYTDRLGARVRAPGIETPPRVDLVTLGCSFGWGFGVDASASFTEVLRARLKIETAILAFPGHGTTQAVLALERHRALGPRIIVYAFIDDHLRRNLSPCAPFGVTGCLPTAFVSDGSDGLKIRPLQGARHDFERNRDVVEDIVKHRAGAFPWDALQLAKGRLSSLLGLEPHAVDSNDLRARAFKLLVDRLAQDAAALGATLIVVRIPSLSQRRRAAPERTVEAALPPGVVYLDLGQAVYDYNQHPDRPRLYLDRDDEHPSVAGQALIAAELAPVVAAHLAPSQR
jgi:hypothetical protein